MRRTIYITLIILSAIIACVAALPWFITVFGADKYISRYFEDTLNKSGQQALTVGRLHLNWTSVHFEEASFMDSNAGSVVRVKGVRFAYNPFKLAANISQPIDAVTEIYLLEPTIIIQGKKDQNDQQDVPADSVVEKIERIWRNFAHIKQIKLTRGQILLQKKSGRLLTLVRELEGWMQHADSSAIDVAVSGEIFKSSSENIKIKCRIDRLKPDYMADISISNMDLQSLTDLKDLGLPHVEQGSLNGKFTVETQSLILDSLNFSGNLSVTDATLTLNEQEFDRIYLSCSLDQNQLVVRDGKFETGGSEFLFNGEVANIYRAEFVGTFTSPHFDPVPFFNHGRSVEGVQGRMSVDGRFHLNPGAVEFDAMLQTGSIQVGSESIRNFESQIYYRNGIVDITRMQFSSLEFLVDASGKVNIKDGLYKGKIAAKRKFEEQLIFDRMSNSVLDATFSVDGNLNDRRLNGTWDYFLHSQNDTILTVGGVVDLIENNFKFRQMRSSAPGLNLQLEIADIFNNPRIKYGYFEKPPLEVLTSRKWIQDLFTENLVECIVSGPVDDLNLFFSVENENNSEKQLTISGNLKNLLGLERDISGDIRFNGFSSSYDINLSRSFLRGSVKSGDYLQGSLDLDLERDEQINSRFTFLKFPVTKIFHDSIFGDAGLINGEIRINGTLDEPGFTASMQGDKFIVNQIGYYKIDFTMSGITKVLKVDSLQIALNNIPVAEGYLDMDISEDRLYAGIWGSDVNVSTVMQSLFDSQDLLSGQMEYRITAQGTPESPKVYSKITLQNGEIDGIAFDQLHLSLRDSVIAGTPFLDYANHSIQVEQLRMVKSGHYHIDASGGFPLYDDGVIDLRMDFEGDFFSFIPHWDSFFTDGACFASISVHVGGTPSKPRLRSGRAQIDRGELWLKSVAKHIENISGKFEYNPETKTVYMHDVHAEVEGQSLEINTVDTVRTSDGMQLQPWFFKDLDLNFGILAMNTPRGGVKVEIDGFMLPGERGSIALEGKTSDEDFYFAGPVRQPTAWGKVILSDTRFSYPFISSGEAKPSVAVRFLQNMNWPVFVIPGEDVQYVRSVPAFIGEVDTELDLDVHSEGLSFYGVIDQNTFRAEGELISTRGRLEYLDLNFRVDNFGVIFNRTEDKPEVYGKAWTTVRDSVGAIPKTIYLELYALDKNTGQVTSRSRWEDFRFRLVSADPAIGETQEQVLAFLGYSVDNIKEKATEVGGAVTENYVIRPLLRPIERRIEKYLGFDLVRFNSSIAKNLFQVSLGQRSATGRPQELSFYQDTFTPYALLFESSEFTLGKYLSQDLYLTYTGQIVTMANPQQNEFNLNHSVGLEYRFLKNLLVEFEYYRERLNYYQIYSDKSYLEDFKIRLRHSFAF